MLPDNIELLQMALGAEAGTADFLDADGVNGSLIMDKGPSSYPVEVDTLDNLCLREKIRPDFIKIDAEGMDCDIILNGKKTLEEHQPVIFFENPAANAATSPQWEKTKIYLSKDYNLLAYQCLNKIFPIDALGGGLAAFERSETLAALNVAAVPK